MRRRALDEESVFRLRPVVADPYRAGMGPLNDRDAGPPRSLDEIEAVLKTIPNASIDRRKLSFVVTREGDEKALRAIFPPNRRELVVTDFSFAGHEMLTLEAALALMPLFGPVAISSSGKDVHVIDGSESIDVLRQRLRERADARMKELADAVGQLNAMLAVPQEPPEQKKARVRREARNAVLGLVAFAAFAFAVMWGMQAMKKAVGEPCTKNDDCRYSACLPREAMKSLLIGSFSMPRGLPSNSAGVCTVDCKTDGDCPAALRCAEVREVETINGAPLTILDDGKPVQRCMPRAWDDDRH